MISFETVRTAWERLRSEVARFPGVRIVAVTKYLRNDALLAQLAGAGIRDLGESYAQELQRKHAVLSGAQPGWNAYRWHFIGHLQSNKVRKVVPLVDMIQSVDSPELFARIEAEAARTGRRIDCLLELKVSNEATKYGIVPDALPGVLERIIAMQPRHATVCGLMCMAPLTASPAESRPYFRAARRAFDDVRARYAALSDFTILSMGMSGDFREALEEGATMIRVGGILFHTAESSSPDAGMVRA